MSDNQLVQEAESFSDLDEFSGLSVVDIAQAIIHWPEGSEDQQRAIAAIRMRAPGIGHNRPPLEEAIEEEVGTWRDYQLQLIETANASIIIDEESAGKVTDLAQKIHDLRTEINEAREARVRPYLQAQRLINNRFSSLLEPLKTAHVGENGKGGLRGMLTVWDDKKREAAEAERQRLLAEARQREEAAARAQEEAEAKAREGKRSVTAELEAMARQDEADRLQRQAEAIRPMPTRSHLGQVGRRRDVEFVIEDLGKALDWLTKQPGLRNNIEQSARTIYGAYFRSIGVAAVDKGNINIPGVKVSVVTGAATIRR